MDKWLTPQEAADRLNVSRQHIYTLADRYQWRTMKDNWQRKYHEADVNATPDANERKRQGYKNRQYSTRSVSLRLKAMQLGHRLQKSPDGRVYCVKCQETVTAIVKGKMRCKR